jgi:hypothetical protein
MICIDVTLAFHFVRKISLILHHFPSCFDFVSCSDEVIVNFGRETEFFSKFFNLFVIGGSSSAKPFRRITSRNDKIENKEKDKNRHKQKKRQIRLHQQKVSSRMLSSLFNPGQIRCFRLFLSGPYCGFSSDQTFLHTRETAPSFFARSVRWSLLVSFWSESHFLLIS